MIKVVDDFFPDPYTLRQFALGLRNYEVCPNFPGKRFYFRLGDRCDDDFIFLNLIKEHSNLDLKVVPNFAPWIGAFDSIDGSYGAGIPHNDIRISKYTCLVFLNPNPQPKSGIEIFDPLDKEYCQEFGYQCMHVKERFFTSSRSSIDRFFYKRYVDRLAQSHPNKIEISNKFNRMVFFDAARIHRAQNYFGNTRDDSRLTFISFLH